MITYILRGLVGTFRADEHQGFIRSHVRLGYPTEIDIEQIKKDDPDHKRVPDPEVGGPLTIDRLRSP